MVVIGAGSGNRGGGHELTSFEILADNESPELSFEPLTPSRVTVSTDKIHFSDNGTEELILRSQRSEEHTSELQSRGQLVCRLLLEKKKEKPQQQQQEP